MIVKTVTDGAPGATSPTLSGQPTFSGPISVLFSKPCGRCRPEGVATSNAIGGTSIQAFQG